MPGTERSKADVRHRGQRVARDLTRAYPDAKCALEFRDAYQLLVATILSAQCTDLRVNRVTPTFFARYPHAKALAAADQAEVEEIIHSTGFFRAKAKNLVAMAKALVESHNGEVPAGLDVMTHLPGVGRKTANVVLGTAFGITTGIVVDTHVKRLAYRLGLTKSKDPVVIERELMQILPRQRWVMFGHLLITHGRRVCAAKKPRCDACVLDPICPRVGVRTR